MKRTGKKVQAMDQASDKDEEAFSLLDLGGESLDPGLRKASPGNVQVIPPELQLSIELPDRPPQPVEISTSESDDERDTIDKGVTVAESPLATAAGNIDIEDLATDALPEASQSFVILNTSSLMSGFPDQSGEPDTKRQAPIRYFSTDPKGEDRVREEGIPLGMEHQEPSRCFSADPEVEDMDEELGIPQDTESQAPPRYFSTDTEGEAMDEELGVLQDTENQTEGEDMDEELGIPQDTESQAPPRYFSSDPEGEDRGGDLPLDTEEGSLGEDKELANSGVLAGGAAAAAAAAADRGGRQGGVDGVQDVLSAESQVKVPTCPASPQAGDGQGEVKVPKCPASPQAGDGQGEPGAEEEPCCGSVKDRVQEPGGNSPSAVSHTSSTILCTPVTPAALNHAGPALSDLGEQQLTPSSCKDPPAVKESQASAHKSKDVDVEREQDSTVSNENDLFFTPPISPTLYQTSTSCATSTRTQQDPQGSQQYDQQPQGQSQSLACLTMGHEDDRDDSFCFLNSGESPSLAVMDSKFDQNDSFSLLESGERESLSEKKMPAGSLGQPRAAGADCDGRVKTGEEQLQRQMSPQNMLDPECRRSLEAEAGALSSSAFRPLPVRPQHWSTQQDLLQGHQSQQQSPAGVWSSQQDLLQGHHGQRQSLPAGVQPHPQQQQHQMMGSSPSAPQWAQQQQGMQQSWPQPQGGESPLPPAWQGQQQWSGQCWPAASQTGQRLQHWPQQRQHSPQARQHYQFHQQQPSRSSASPTGNQGYSTPRGSGSPGYSTPRGGGSPGYNTPPPRGTGSPGFNIPRSAGSPSYNTPRGAGSPGYNTPRGIGSPAYNTPRGDGSPGYNTPRGYGQDQAAGGTIKVSSVNLEVDLEHLQLYFESARSSGGGPLADLDDCPDQGFILLTFKDPAVVERVLARTHCVAKQTLVVSLYEKEEEEEEEEEAEEEASPAEGEAAMTVQVSGGTIALDEEMMELYFDNVSKSGGGGVTRVTVMADRGVTLITFDNQRAAEAVVTRAHRVGNTTLTVAPYRPLSPPTKVKVSGLAPTVTDELLELYFDRFGKVTDVQLDAREGQAVVTFMDPQDAQTAVEKKHTISRKPVSVSLLTSVSITMAIQDSDTAPPGAATAAAAPESFTVQVKGLARRTVKDTLDYYFQNTRRSGGGLIQQVDYQEGSGVALITFQEANAVKGVIAKKHNLDDQPLEVSVWRECDDQQLAVIDDVENREDRDDLEDREGLSTTVAVTGLSVSTSTDTLRDYFENQRRSSGGEVVDVSLNAKKETFFVKFVNPQDAANVVSKKHKLEGQRLVVRLYTPPEMYTDCLVLYNLPELKSSEQLELFVENISKAEVATTLFAEEEGTAVVMFSCKIDLFQVKAAVTRTPFQGSKLMIDFVPVSCTVLVTDLPVNPVVTEDAVTNYFENVRRSNGGPVIAVELCCDGQRALVTFEDREVAERVASMKHKLQGAQVTVSVYMECLGPGGGSEEPPVKTPPPRPLCAEDVERLVLLDLLPRARERLTTALTQCNARLDQTQGAASLVCTLHCTGPSGEGRRAAVETWGQEAEQVLNRHLKDTASQRLDVMQEEWGEINSILEDHLCEMPDIAFTYDRQTNVLLVAYQGQDQKKLVDVAVTKVTAAQRDVQRNKEEKTETLKLSKGKQLLLQRHDAIKKVAEQYSNLSITYKEEEGVIELRGLVREIQAVKVAFLETSDNVTSVSVPWKSALHYRLLESAAARETVECACRQAAGGNLDDVVLLFMQDGLMVFSFDAERAERVQVAAKQALQQRVIKLTTENREVVQTQEWNQLKTSVEEGSQGQTLLQQDDTSLTIVSVSAQLQKNNEALRRFLQEHSTQQNEFPLPEALQGLFRCYLQDKVDSLQLEMSDVTFDAANDRVLVKGNAVVTDSAREIYAGFLQEFAKEQQVFTQPSMGQFLTMREWLQKKAEIKRDLKCLVMSPEELPRGFMGWEDALAKGKSSSPAKASGGNAVPEKNVDTRPAHQRGADLQDTDDFHAAPAYQPDNQPVRRRAKKLDAAPIVRRPLAQPKSDLPARPRLYLSVMSDITKEEHHVLVNSSNPQLFLGQGQVSKALLEVGGAGIQQELKAAYPQGISHSDLAVSSGGKLVCKKLFHCCLPEEKDGEKIQQIVRDAVTRCLQEADRLQMGSIGFPSLGTGNLAYPAPMVASTMFKAALDYGRKNPHTQISDVFFILHKKDTALTKVFREEESQYKQMLKDSRPTAELEEEELFTLPANPTAEGIKSFPYFQDTAGRVKQVVVGLGREAVKRAAREMVEAYSLLVGSVKEDAPQLEQWDTLHVETLKNACRAVQVDITFNFSLGRLELRGFRGNLGKIPLHQTLKDAEAAVSEKYQAQLSFKQVQWSYIEIDEEGEVLVPYDITNNHRIESAYQSGETKAIIMDADRKAFFINFDKMEETPEFPEEDEDPSPVKVIRRNKINSANVQPPREWSAMAGGSDLDVVPLNATSAEYTTKAQTFLDSLGKPNATVVKIERVQNLTLYKQYEALKRQMQSALGDDRPCERKPLYHGTKDEAVQGIIKYGFNRSYNDLKKSAFGQGAYFALTAEYSSRNEYAMADPHGNRNMFMCRVLVGQFTVGKQDMRTPPEITPGGQRYNSTVNDDKKPDIFVTYNDVQAYPEYRIVFRDD